MRKQTNQEELANVITHAVGIVFSVLALFIGLSSLKDGADWVSILGISIFLVSAFLMFSFSTIYHAVKSDKAKEILRLFDHIAIYLLIAGTYTPFLLIGIGGKLGWGIFFTIWLITSLGILFKSIFKHRFPKLSLAIYLLLGWFAIFIAKPLYTHVSIDALIYLISGGLAYTIGTIFYSMKNVKYTHAIWHVFVFVGVFLHFIAMFYLI